MCLLINVLVDSFKKKSVLVVAGEHLQQCLEMFEEEKRIFENNCFISKIVVFKKIISEMFFFW